MNGKILINEAATALKLFTIQRDCFSLNSPFHSVTEESESLINAAVAAENETSTVFVLAPAIL